MTIVVMLATGFVVALALWWLLRAALANPMLERENYRGEAIPTALGFVGVLAYVVVTATGAVLESFGWVDQPVAGISRSLVLPAVLGFALLGLFDDLAGSGHHRGFLGHVRELWHGRVTTGMLKLLGGGFVAAATVAALPRQVTTSWLFLDAAVVALAANLANLFDRAPGRSTKVALVAFVVLVLATGAGPELAGPALLVGASLALLVPELAERGMVGDTGANALGAALGMGVVLSCSQPWRLLLLGVLVVMNLASEWVSFSSVIDAVRPLRWLDRWGNRRP